MQKKWTIRAMLPLMILLVFFCLCDYAVEKVFTPYFRTSGNFILDDYELTRNAHPEAVWEKVFYGNSSIVSGYREELSNSGYVEFGLSYGMFTDLEKILKSDEITIGSDLVVGVNWAAMFDNMETNPNYYWHRGPLTPYSYFQRDRLQKVVEGKLRSVLTGEEWARAEYADQTKEYYYGTLNDKEMAAKEERYRTHYWYTGVEGCQENMAALRSAVALCRDQGIRMRLVLMPWNPIIEMPEVIAKVYGQVREICTEEGVELLDLTDAFPLECFHDLGHLNKEYGSHQFMEVIEPWLCS